MNNDIKRGGLVAAMLLGCLGLAVSAQGASFDCGKAGTKVEHIICDDPEISKLDDELSLAYKTALQDEKEADSTKQAQKQWMKERNGCVVAGCVKSAYEARLLSVRSKISFPVSSSAEAKRSDYVLIPLPQYYPDRASFGGELSEPPKDPKACELYLQNLRYFTRNNLPLSCGQPVAPTLTDKIKPVEWENLDPEKYPELFKVVMEKVIFSWPSTYPSEAALSSWRESVRKGSIVFRRAKLELRGHVYLPSQHSPTETAIAYQIVQFGFNVTDPDNPNPRFRCKQSAERVMPRIDQTEMRFFIASENLQEFYGDMSDHQSGFGDSIYHNLWLINGLPYGELYNDKDTVLLSEIRSDSFARACLFHYKKH